MRTSTVLDCKSTLVARSHSRTLCPPTRANTIRAIDDALLEVVMVCCNPDLATEQKAVHWATFHLLLVSTVTATGIALDLYVAGGIAIATFLVCAVILAMKAPKSGSLAYVAIGVLALGLLGGTASQLPRMFSDMEELRTGKEDLATFIDL